MRNSAIWLALAAGVILLDQASKQWVLSAFSLHETVPVTAFFNLILVYNTGAAFSFLAGGGVAARFFFITIAVVASFVILRLLRRHSQERLFSLALALILGGALGNLIDRILLSHVVDFLDFHAFGVHFPAFNVADMAITGGAFLLVWESFSKPDKAG